MTTENITANESNLIRPLSKILHQEAVIPVDHWIPEEQDNIFKHVKGAIVLPVSAYYGIYNNSMLDNFVLIKKSYNSEKLRTHLCHYLNYFEKFYDKEKELLAVYFKMKYLIDYEEGYTEEALAYDINRYILNGIVFYKARKMNTDNYSLNLTYRNNRNPELQYSNKHGAILMEISLLMNIMIPILTHFVYVRNIKTDKFFYLKMFELIFAKYDVDIMSKLFETSVTTIETSRKKDSVLWDMQSIRAKSIYTHSIQTVENIILQIIPKYTYEGHIIKFNYESIQRALGYQVIDIDYGFNLVSVSSSNRDEDNNSDFDKFEAHLTKQNEALYIQNKVNCEETMKLIELEYGPFDENEIQFFMRELSADGRQVIVPFQKKLIFSLFYRYFGDPESIKAINKRDYVILIIAAKKILKHNNMISLPYIISSKIDRIVQRQTINKKELMKLEASQYYPIIKDKYKNDKIIKNILSIIATILSSKFTIVSYDEPELNGQPIPIIPDFICEEVLMFINMI